MTEYSTDNRSRSPTCGDEQVRIRHDACRWVVTAVALLAIGVVPVNARAQAIAENTLASAWTTTAEWTLEEDLRIWGPPDAYLSLVRAVAADSRDNIYILDYVEQEIYVFDAAGEFVRTIGGQGDGPGEFRNALGPAIAPGDTLWVADQRAPR